MLVCFFASRHNCTEAVTSYKKTTTYTRLDLLGVKRLCLCVKAAAQNLMMLDLYYGKKNRHCSLYFRLYKSAVMFAWIAALLVVYVIAVLFCRRIDLHNARKGGVVYLQDNAVTDHQKYEITLETGFRKGAGTTAKVNTSAIKIELCK